MEELKLESAYLCIVIKKQSINKKNKKIMAKTRMMVKQVLMSVVTLVSFVMVQYENFNRVASIGGGLVGMGYYSSEGR